MFTHLCWIHEISDLVRFQTTSCVLINQCPMRSLSSRCGLDVMASERGKASPVIIITWTKGSMWNFTSASCCVGTPHPHLTPIPVNCQHHLELVMDIEQYTLDSNSSIFLLIVKASHRMNGTCRNIYFVCIKIRQN